MKLFTSHKASSTAVNLPFAIIVAIIVAGVLIFGVIPMATKPLGTDPCLQQNGVRAQYCEDDISARNNFIEVDDKNNICCMALPGKQEEFKLWSRTLADTDRPGEASTGVVHASNAAELYSTSSGIIAIYLETSEDGRKTLAQESSSYEAVVTNPTNVPFLEPGSNFVIAGVNNLADGECTFAIYEASIFLDSANPTYRPKQTADGRLVPPRYGFNYERKDCKQGNGVQITGQLQGRPYASPYYIAVYSLRTESGTPAIRASALLNVSLPKPTDTAEGTTSQGSSGPVCPSTAPSCDTFTNWTSCVNLNQASISGCPGCNWHKTGMKKQCITCVIDNCSDYTTWQSCDANPCFASNQNINCAWHKGNCFNCEDLNCKDFTSNSSCVVENPCGGGCSWTGKNCLDCDDVNACSDYPDKPSCQNDACEKTLDCNWKNGWFITNVCEDAPSDDES